MNQEKKCRLFLGWYQIIGALIGIGFLLVLPITIPFNFFIQYFIVSIGILMYGFSILVGIAVLKNRKNALKLSLINQFAQIIKFSILGFGYQYVAGLFIYFGIELSNAKYIFEIGTSSWAIEWNWNSTSKEIHINIIAVLLIFFIEYIKTLKKSKEEIPLHIDKARING